MNNIAIKESLKAHGMKQWMLAELLGTSEGRLSRKLSRHELPADEQARIIAIIEGGEDGAGKNS